MAFKAHGMLLMTNGVVVASAREERLMYTNNENGCWSDRRGTGDTSIRSAI